MIPGTETDRCNVVDCPPGINATQKLKRYVQLTAMSHLGGLGHLVLPLVVEATRLGKGAMVELGNRKLLVRDKIADASNNGKMCASARSKILLTETNTCNDVKCIPAGPGNLELLCCTTFVMIINISFVL